MEDPEQHGDAEKMEDVRSPASGLKVGPPVEVQGTQQYCSGPHPQKFHADEVELMTEDTGLGTEHPHGYWESGDY